MNKKIRNIVRKVLFEFNLYDIYKSYESNKRYSYYFKVDEYEYQVNFIPFKQNDQYYSLDFRVMKDGTDYHIFDTLTNKNVYRVMNTISDIVYKFYNKRKENVINDLKRHNVEDKWPLVFKGFTFTLEDEDPKKNAQRLLLYKRYLKKYNFQIEEDFGNYYITENIKKQTN